MGLAKIENFAPRGFSAVITPSDTADVDQQYAEGVDVGGSGDIAFEMQDGTNHTMTFTAGDQYACHFRKILATGTTATNIKGIRISQQPQS